MDRRQLDREQRLEVIGHLWQEGHSNVAIGKALGISEGQVRKDVKQVRTSTNLTAPNRKIGLDGKSYPAVRKHVTRPQDANRGRPEHVPRTAPL